MHVNQEIVFREFDCSKHMTKRAKSLSSKYQTVVTEFGYTKETAKSSKKSIADMLV